MTKEVRTVRYTLGETLDKERRRGGVLHAVQYRERTHWITLTPELESHIGISFFNSNYQGEGKMHSNDNDWTYCQKVASVAGGDKCLSLAGAKVVEGGIKILLFEIEDYAYYDFVNGRTNHIRGDPQGRRVEEWAYVEGLSEKLIKVPSGEREELSRVEYCNSARNCDTHKGMYAKSRMLISDLYRGGSEIVKDFAINRKIGKRNQRDGTIFSQINSPFAITSIVSDESFKGLKAFLKRKGGTK